MNIGATPDGQSVDIDVQSLIGDHLCVVANSGGGKSGFIRKLLEVTHGHVQHIILDPEDEFYTLRQHLDYVLAGGDDGDCPATVENAADMAIMLLTTGLSAIIQLNHLKAGQQEAFVSRFLTAVMEAPQKLWHPCLFVLDEAHRWAPQNGGSAAFEAMKDFTSRGRKRGFTAVLATQRMAKIDKNVTDSVNNWALGRVGQATDRKVMAEALGFRPASPEARGIQALPPRHFWVFGMAFDSTVARLLRVGDVESAMVKAGQAKIPTLPAPAAVKQLLEGLKASPAPDVAAKASAAATPPSQAALTAAEGRGYDLGRRDGEADGYDAGYKKAYADIHELMRDHLDKVFGVNHQLMDKLNGAPVFTAKAGPAADYKMTMTPERKAAPPRPIDGTVTMRISDRPAKISRAVQDIIAFYESIHPRAVPFMIAAKQAGVGMKSSQFRTYEPELLASGAVEAVGDRYRALIASGSPEQYLDKVDVQLAPKHRAIFQFIRRASRPVTKDEIIVAADVSPTSSTTTAALSLLQHEAGVIERVGDTHYQLAEAFR